MPAAWAVVASAAMIPDGLMVRTRTAFLALDPADLGAYVLRGANAHAGRLPGSLDGPPAVLNPELFAFQLAAPQPPPRTDRFYLEYPAPALGLFWLEAALAGPAALPPVAADTEHTDVAFHRPRTDAERAVWGRLQTAARLHIALMAVALVGLLAVLRAGYTPDLAAGRAVWLAVLPGAVYFALMRYDILPALATALAFWCVGRGRWGWAGAFLAVGVGLKLYPVLFLPVLLRLTGGSGIVARRASEGELHPRSRVGLRSDAVRLLAGFILGLFAIAAACVLAVGVEGTVNPIRVQLNRPPELLGWGLYDRFLPAALAYSSAGRLGLLAAVTLACVVTRPADLASALRRCGLILLAFTLLAVFWSPQWLVWFLPLTVPLAAAERRTGWATAAVDVTNYLSFPVLFHLVWGQLPVAGRWWAAEGLIVLRTLAWAWLGWRFLVGGRVLGGFDLAAVRAAVTPPRGLTWASVEAADEPVVSVGRALVPVTVRFDPVPGGGLEDVPQAREPRPAVAVFVPRGGRWVPTGKLVFNLSAADLATRLP